jgi:hypothetical protein
VVEGVVMAAVIVLNAATGKGNMAALSSRFRHWGAPVAANSALELLQKDDTAPN